MSNTNGEPRYHVSRIPGRLIWRWAVMCGTGTGRVYVTWRFLQALRVCSTLEGAWADGIYMARQQLPEGMRHCTIRFIECEIGHGRLTATNWIDHGCPWCKIADGRAELEREQMRLAACGTAALGYFDGCADEYRSASLEDVLKLRDEVRRLRQVKGASYSRSYILELLGYLTGAIPELHAFESGKMISLLEEFERKHQEPKL